MNFLKKYKNIISLGLSACMAVVVLSNALVLPVFAVTKEELESAKKQYQQQLEEERNKLSSIQTEKKNATEAKQSLEKQSDLISSQIDILLDQISETQELVAKKQQEVADKQAEIDQRWADFKARMAAMQQLHDGGAVAMLSNCTSLYEMLTFNETLQQITEKDNQVLAELEQARTELAEQQAQLEETQAQLEDQQAQLEGKQDELAENIQQQNENITAAAAAEQAQSSVVQATEAKFNEAANALDAYIRSQNSQYATADMYCSLNFGNVLPSYKYLTTLFGEGGHGGTDMAAPGGTPIYAAADGIVTISAYHYSYGNYVQIYHGADDDGKTYATLYAHMIQTPSVSVGQTVSKGDTIGYVGNTGNSYGYHLHLELRINGVRSDPMPYIPH